MAVARHLGIDLEDYDRKIRSFIPGYDVMLSTAAGVLRLLTVDSPLIVDLGIGTGALAQACLAVRPDARVHGVDEDAAILDMARSRLRDHPDATFVEGSFLQAPLPACDAIVASLALHHVRTSEHKAAFYRACREALRPGGLLVSADCFPASDPAVAAEQRREWRAHLEAHYSSAETERFFTAWAEEDVYLPLLVEIELLRSAGLAPDVVWRAGCFGVIAARR